MLSVPFLRVCMYLCYCWDSKMLWDFEYANEEYHVHHDIAVYKEQYEGNCERIRSLVDYHKYMNDLSKIIGCRPHFFKTISLNFLYQSVYEVNK